MAYQTVTLSTLQSRLAERYESVPFWTGEEARRGFNEALRVWNAITGFWRTPQTCEATANDPYIVTTGAMVWQTRVRFNNVPLVGPISIREMDLIRPQWRSETDASGGDVPTSPQWWIKVSMTQLAIWPASSTTQPNAVEVDGVCSTPILVDPGDYIDLGEEEHNVLLGYALHRVSLKLGGQIWLSTRPLYLAFLKAAADRNDQFAACAWYRQQMGLDNQRFLVRPRRPSPVKTPALQEQDGGN